MCTLRLTVDTIAAERLLRDDADTVLNENGEPETLPSIEDMLEAGVITYEELAQYAGTLARVEFEAITDDEG